MRQAIRPEGICVHEARLSPITLPPQTRPKVFLENANGFNLVLTRDCPIQTEFKRRARSAEQILGLVRAMDAGMSWADDANFGIDRAGQPGRNTP